MGRMQAELVRRMGFACRNERFMHVKYARQVSSCSQMHQNSGHEVIH